MIHRIANRFFFASTDIQAGQMVVIADGDGVTVAPFRGSEPGSRAVGVAAESRPRGAIVAVNMNGFLFVPEVDGAASVDDSLELLGQAIEELSR